jgi:hypothetical protein
MRRCWPALTRGARLTATAATTAPAAPVTTPGGDDAAGAPEELAPGVREELPAPVLPKRKYSTNPFFRKKRLVDFPLVAADYDAANATPLGELRSDAPQRVAWTCAVCAHRWTESVLERTMRGGTSCPPCAAKDRVLLSQISPRVLAEFHAARNDVFLDAAALCTDDKALVWWACGDCGHEYAKRVRERFTTLRGVTRTRDVSCPQCLATRRGPDVHQRLVDEWHAARNGDLDRAEVLRDITVRGARSRMRVWWRCGDCGTDWKALPRRRSMGHDNCPQCVECHLR